MVDDAGAEHEAAGELGAGQERLAAKEPSINVKIENKTVALNYRNLTEVTVNYYPMDLEFLFSGLIMSDEHGATVKEVQPPKR